MKTKCTFSSLALQEIDSEAETVISSHLQSLDRVSNDIKSLEEKLKVAAIPFTFVYVLSSKEFVLHEDDSSYNDKEIWDDLCLVWGKNETNDFRLLYNVYVTEDFIAQGSCSESSPELKSSKPLIESKSRIRLQIENELPDFYRKIIKALESKTREEIIFEFSPNHDDSVCMIYCRHHQMKDILGSIKKECS